MGTTMEKQMDNEAISRIITKWKDQLETQYLYISQATSGYGRAYICSPCTAGTAKGVQRNVQAARFYMWYAFENMEVIARAPHAYLPILLSDKLPAERALALRFGLELLEQSDMVFVCGKLLSTGMKGEIARAVELSIPIIVYDAELYLKVRKLVTRYGGDKAQVKLHSINTANGKRRLLHPQQLISLRMRRDILPIWSSCIGFRYWNAFAIW